jgi:hypothetical protein
MSTQMRRVLLGVLGAATVAALTIPGAAFAKGPGGGGETTLSNNLSVPAVFVGSNGYSLTCDGTSIAPEDSSTSAVAPLTGYYIDPDAYFYVQGTHKWQAACRQGFTTATATAAWGDNLAGDAKLKVGSPIRVELGLFADTTAMELDDMTGWVVAKLDDTLDRLSAYGTLATGTTDGFVSSPATPFIDPVTESAEVRVWAPGTLDVRSDGSSLAGFPKAAAAEINATGRVVFGYNLRVTAAGDYDLVFTFPDVDITDVDAGFVTYELDSGGGPLPYGHTVTLPITVIGGGGSGGRR